MQIIDVFLRVVITIVVLFVMARINGPKQIAQMSFYDYVSGISVGSIAATISINANIAFSDGLFAIVLFLAVSLLLNKITQKNAIANTLLTGEPIYLIEKGMINKQGLHKSKMTISELLSNLRYHGYFNIHDVYTAILEPTGKLSVQPKGYARDTQNNDLQLEIANPKQVVSVIMDGAILHENLVKLKKDEKWLMQALDKQSAKIDIKKIMLAILDENDQLILYKDD